MRLDDVKWEEIKVVSEVPKGALEPTQIPDCVFPQCGETHRDGESGTCRMCGRRATDACLNANLQGYGDALSVFSVGFKDATWVCPVCTVRVHQGVQQWDMRDKSEGKEAECVSPQPLPWVLSCDEC